MMITSRIRVLVTLGLLCCYVPVKCGRILGVFSFASKSHYILGNSLLRSLAAAGHDVTMISPYEDKNPPKNGSYRDIVLTGFIEDLKVLTTKLNFFDKSQQSIFDNIEIFSMMTSNTEKTFIHPNVKTLLNSDEKFDVVIVEQFMNDAAKIFANHFKAPLIIFNSQGANSWVNYIAGNPSPPSYIPHTMSNLSPHMSFTERLKNLLIYTIEYTVDSLVLFPKNRKVARNFFPDTDLRDIYHDASIILLNSHESFNQPVPMVPNMIEIGGFHVAPPKKLPKDLQDFLDNAKEGVIYFSMGSNLKSAELPPEKRDMLLKAFSKLKQKILWKWEEEDLPGQPANVKLGKWLPQQDILAHPNVKLFITHGGLLSTIETVYHGVPILAIPVYADQHSNANNAVYNGFALSIPYDDPSFSEEKLSKLLNELINNPRYRENAINRSKLFHDRPMKPIDAAVYWVEFVIRHKGALHLRVAGATMPLYKYLLLDVIAFLVAVNIFGILLLGLAVRYFIRRRKQNRSKKIKTS